MEGAYLSAGGPIFLGVLILLTLILKWPRWTNYIWGIIVILWGLTSLI